MTSQEFGFSQLFLNASEGLIGSDYDDAFWMTSSTMDALSIALKASSKEDLLFLVGQYCSFSFQFGRPSFSFGHDDLTVLGDGKILGERIGLDAASLRRAFTFLEYSVFFLCKYPRLKGDQNYRPDTETYSERIKTLKERSLVSTSLAKKLNLLKQTRDQFAHSFVEIGDLTYNGMPLRKSTEFLSDLISAANELETEFVKIQGEQVDWRIFKLVFTALVERQK